MKTNKSCRSVYTNQLSVKRKQQYFLSILLIMEKQVFYLIQKQIFTNYRLIFTNNLVFICLLKILKILHHLFIIDRLSRYYIEHQCTQSNNVDIKKKFHLNFFKFRFLNQSHCTTTLKIGTVNIIQLFTTFSYLLFCFLLRF